MENNSEKYLKEINNNLKFFFYLTMAVILSVVALAALNMYK